MATTKVLIGVLSVMVIVAATVGFIVATQPSTQPTTSPTPTTKPSPSPSPTPTQTSQPTTTKTPTPQTPTPTATPAPVLTEQEEIRNSIMNYIASKHPETATYMTNLVWTGGRTTPENIVGAETYMYFSSGWNVTLSYPVVPQPIYQVSADYKAQGISIPIRIIWQGTYQNQVINETSYVFAQ